MRLKDEGMKTKKKRKKKKRKNKLTGEKENLEFI
jgi:hypothetical protein